MSDALSTRVGLYFGLLQLTFGLIWVEYTIFLPQLASNAGIGGATASWILVLDQVIFALCDLAAGVAVDRVAKVVGRLGKIIAVLTAVSALAFLLLPFVARLSASVFVFLIVVWAITSTALRAPTLALLGRYTPVSRQHWVGSLFVIGLGLATASAPILGTRITAYDPRIEFGSSALAVFAATLAIIWAEKDLARTAPPETSAPAQVPISTLISFLAAVLLLQIGFQVHWFINAQQFFARFAGKNERPVVLFWIGFTFLMPLASLLAKRFGSVVTMAVAALSGAASALVAAHADDLERYS
jgi:MFS family permease